MKMSVEELLKLSSEIRDSIKTYIFENEDYGDIIDNRERDVTRKVDFFAEKTLEEALKRRNLCARIISEELGDHIFPKGCNPEFTLIFDPIDGSTNATLGIPFFCSSIAYSPKVERVTFDDLQASVVSTIYGKTYYAAKGKKAYVDGKELPQKIKGKNKRVFSVYTYGTDSMPIPADLLKLQNKDIIVRVLGSIAVELCLVAEGVLDAVIDIRNIINGYDIAGSVLILKEAGGIITDLKGADLTEEVGKMESISFVATLEEGLHEEILKIFR
ncbi:MAG: inositol monophosphatase family protein [Candidatus Methanospirareceae archaeon]